jgi:carboxymethylenebutenolidase
MVTVRNNSEYLHSGHLLHPFPFLFQFPVGVWRKLMTERPQITQAMIDAYDEYTHLTLDRRSFMEKLTRLAGSGAAAAAIAPLLAADPAMAALVPADDERISSEIVSFPGQYGEVSGYLVRPAGVTGTLPGIVVIHENRGLNEHIRDIARRLSLEGFMAMAVDFLSPQGGTPEDQEDARNMIRSLDGGQITANAVSAVSYLSDRPDCTGAVGAIGFCWGGGFVNQLAVASPDLKAAVSYYGAQPDPADVPRIKAALLLHYAGMDNRINAGIDGYRQALETNGKDFTVYIYNGVNHAFNNDTSGARYNKQAADLAWTRTVAFFHEKLS